MYIGIDLSLSATGYCVYSTNGFIVTADEIPTRPSEFSCSSERIDYIVSNVCLIINRHSAGICSLEGYSYGSTGRSFHIGELGGVMKYELWRRSIPILVIPPRTLKKWATGKGNAPKIEMIERAAQEVGNLDISLSDNVSDAILLARYVFQYQKQGLTAEFTGGIELCLPR